MHIILYMKEPCLLCEEVEGLLATLQHDYPHTLEKRDIHKKEAWLEEYQLSIPVIEINGEQLHAGELDATTLEKFLDKHKRGN